MPKKKPKLGKPKVHKDLEGFEINFNEFGELKTNMSVEELNKFLNKRVDDKKLRDRDDLHDEWQKEAAAEAAENEEAEKIENLRPEEMDDVDDKDLKNLTEEEDSEDE